MKTQVKIQTKINYFVCLLALMFIGVSGWGQTTTITIDAPGASQWPVPVGVDEITVEAWGGGGKGGNVVGYRGTGGGGAGAYSTSVISVTTGDIVNITVGGQSQNSTVIVNSSQVIARGGANVPDNSIGGGSGGAWLVGDGDSGLPGGSGALGGRITYYVYRGGAGGNSPNGGNGGAQVSASIYVQFYAPGNPGNPPGGGGGGALSSSYTAWALGGSGAPGRVKITYTIASCTNATLTLSSDAGTDDQTVCIHTAITPITYDVGGDANGANVTGLPAGVTYSYSGGVVTISGTPTVSGPFSYIVETTDTPSGCSETSLGGTIEVDGNLTTYYEDVDDDGFGNSSVSVQACSQPSGYVLEGGDCDDGDVTVYPGAPEICDSKDNNCSGFVDYDDPAVVLATVYNVTGGGSYCDGGAGVAIGLSNSETGVEYQLFRDGSTAVGSPVAGTGSPINFGNQIVAGTYTVEATLVSGGCTNDMNGNAVVIVEDIPNTPGSISGGTTVCPSATEMYTISAVSGATNYNWSVPSGWTLIDGQGTIEIEVSSSSTAGASGTLSVTAENNCGESTAATLSVSIVNALTISHNTNPLTVCSGYNPSPIGSTAGGGQAPYTYQWFLNGDPINDATTSDYNENSIDTPGIYSYNVEVTDACGTTAASTPKVITVLEDPTVTQQPAAITTVCENDNVTLTGEVEGGTGTLTYEWYSNTTNSNSGGTLIPGADDLSYSPPTDVAGTYYYYFRFIATGSGCNLTTSEVAEVVVNQAPAFTVCPSDINETTDPGQCSALVNYDVTVTGIPTPDLEYEFTGDTTGNGNGTGSGSTFNVGVTTVTITASNSCGSDVI